MNGNAYPPVLNVNDVYKNSYLDKLKELAERVRERNIVIYSYPTDYTYTVKMSEDLDTDLLAISESPYYKEMKNLPLNKQSNHFKTVHLELLMYPIHKNSYPGWSWFIENPTTNGGVKHLIRKSDKNYRAPYNYEQNPYQYGGIVVGKRRSRKTRSKKTRRKIRR